MPIAKWLIVFITCLILQPIVYANNKDVLTVSNPYMPAVPKVSKSAAVYLTLTNSSKSKVVLIGVSTPIARHSMIHRTVESDGVVKMMHHADLIINPGDSIEFKPNGMHIMLMGLQVNPIPNSFKLNLIFRENSQQIEVNVRTRND